MPQEGSLPRLHFKGKVFVENHHLAVPFHELLPVREKGLSEKASLRDNLVVHGDNLAALKSLLPTYHGKVKCVYIDPPYNTGNEGWAYNDNVNSPLMRDWLGRVVDRDDLTRHDKWCCMMMPRLKLLSVTHFLVGPDRLRDQSRLHLGEEALDGGDLTVVASPPDAVVSIQFPETVLRDGPESSGWGAGDDSPSRTGYRISSPAVRLRVPRRPFYISFLRSYPASRASPSS